MMVVLLVRPSMVISRSEAVGACRPVHASITFVKAEPVATSTSKVVATGLSVTSRTASM